MRSDGVPLATLLALVLGAAVLGVALAGDESKPPQTASLSGTLRDAKGKPVAGASVSVEGGGGAAKTAADGTWTIAPVVPGDPLVTVKVLGRLPVQAQLRVAAGESRRWDAMLAPPGVLQGRVVDEYGHPLTTVPGGGKDSGWLVEAMPLQPWMNVNIPAAETSVDRTAADGSFRLLVGRDALYRLRVLIRRTNSRVSVLQTEPTTGGIADVTLRVLPANMPHSRLRCRIESSDGSVVTGPRTSETSAVLFDGDGSWVGHLAFDAATTRWISDSVPTGTYTVVAQAPQRRAFEFAPVEVRDAADVDVGPLRFPATSRVRFVAERSGPLSDSDARVSVFRVRSLEDFTLWRFPACVDLPALQLHGDAATETDLCPGRYVAWLDQLQRPPSEQLFVRVEVPFEVRVGESHDVTVPVRGAPVRAIRPRYSGRSFARALVVISDPSGVNVGRWWDEKPGELEAPCCLLPGPHTVVAYTSDARRLTATLDIPAENAPERFDVVLR